MVESHSQNIPGPGTDSDRRRRVANALFATLLGAYAYFFQGGGWNQNSRLAQVRAVVEQGTFAVNDYLLYRHIGRRRLVRQKVPPGTPWEKVAEQASSADVLIAPASGFIVPNKPPGTVAVAAPFYAVILTVERALGASPDHWGVLTVNSHLVTLLSVGLAGALTGVVMMRLSCSLFPQISLTAHAAAALTSGLGTLMLPYSTVLFDHVLAAFWPLLAFAILVVDRGRPGRAVLAGLAAGMGVLTNYTIAVIVALLFVYCLAHRRWGDAARYVVGLLPPLLLLAIYQTVCFGTPLVMAKPLLVPLVDQAGLGLFSWPDPEVLWNLLVGAKRGLLLSSPVLAMAAWGLVWAWRAGRRAEAAIAAGTFLSFLLINASFGYWQAGWSIGPRYLVPGVAFLALGLAPAFARFPRTTGVLAVASAGVLLLATAVDVQPPRRARNPLQQYIWPLWRGKTINVNYQDLKGPVSVNPIGVYEGTYFKLFPPGSRVTRWNSYNLGELVWPESRLSLLPLAAWLGVGVTLTLARSRVDRREAAMKTRHARSEAVG